ncbi:hypothetical protein [Steroidobacter cummioxidans]|uniref:hypothetical protein n=1 Tax=Steroidobacter cummioxidans TaxID=1803913 RepID=UPI001290895B|nr:hypothetical protein [Steroidobacter cummioxidans]
MAIQPTQPQGIGGVLDTAFHLYKSSFGVVWPIGLLLAIVNVLPVVYLLFVGMPSFDPVAVAGNPFGIYGDHPMALVIALLSGVLSMWVTSALLLKQYAIGIGEEMSTGGAFQAALARLLPLFGASILFGLAVLVGLLLLIVPGLILMVSLVLYMTLLLFENKGPIESLTGSHKLVWGNWWRSCAVLTLLSILLFVILIALGFVAALVIPFAGLAVADAFMVGMVMQALSNFAFYIFLGPFGSAAFIALYWDLKLRKEGGDLAARVNALSAA